MISPIKKKLKHLKRKLEEKENEPEPEEEPEPELVRIRAPFWDLNLYEGMGRQLNAAMLSCKALHERTVARLEEATVGHELLNQGLVRTSHFLIPIQTKSQTLYSTRCAIRMAMPSVSFHPGITPGRI